MKNILWLCLIAVVLAGCSSKPSDNEIERQLFGDNNDELFHFENFKKIDGFQKDDKTYIADVKYRVTFKLGHKEATKILSQGAMFGAYKEIPYAYLMGENFDKGSAYTITKQVTLLKKESGWTISNMSVPEVQRIFTEEEKKAAALKKKQDEDAAALKKKQDEDAAALKKKQDEEEKATARKNDEKRQAAEQRYRAEGKILEDDPQKFFATFKRNYSGITPLDGTDFKANMAITQFSENQLTANLNIEIAYPGKAEEAYTLALRDIVISNLTKEQRAFDKLPPGRNVSWYFKGSYTPHEKFDSAPFTLTFDLFHSNQGPVVILRFPAKLLRSSILNANFQFSQRLLPSSN